MSNRNFDASVITKRLGNKAIAKSIISNFNNVNSQPQTSNMNASIINEVELGNSLFVTRGPTCTTYDLGCPCPLSTSVIPQTSVTPQSGWATRIIGTGGSNEFGYNVAVDSNNNIIVIGSYGFQSVPTQGPITIYNADGSIFGTLNSSGGFDTYIVKYDSNGTGIWATRISATVPGVASEVGVSITVDSSNNIIVTGYYQANITIYNAPGGSLNVFGTLLNSGGADTFIVKYDSNGTGIWATRIAGTVTGNEFSTSVTVDSLNNIIVTGTYDSSPVTIYNAPGGNTNVFGTLLNDGSYDAFIVKYNGLTGIGIWATRIAGTGFDSGNSITVDSLNNIIVTGNYTSTATIYNEDTSTFGTLPFSGSDDAYIVKYGSNGIGTWATRLTGTDFTQGVAVDSNNDIILIGNSTSPLTIYNVGGSTTLPNLPNSGSSDAFIVKYGSNGIGIWATRIGGSLFDSGYGVAVDSNNNIIVTGSYRSSPVTIYNAPGGNTDISGTLSNSGGYEVYIVKYTSNGFAN